MAYKDSVLADSPKVYLPFTGSSLSTNLGSRSGVTVTDSTVASWSTGIVDDAPVFGGPTTSGHITYDVNNNNIFTGSTWTVEVWFKRNTSQNNYSTIFFTAGGTSQVQLFLQPTGGADDRKITGRYKVTGGGSVVDIKGPSITDTNWHHVVLTTNGTTVTMYLDGSSVGTGTHYAQSTIGSSDPVRIASYGTASGQENFYGSIDEVAMYDTNLSSTRVSAHYAARLSVDGGYTAQAMTSTATMPGGVGEGHPFKLVTNFDDQVLHLTHVPTVGSSSNYSLTTGNLVIGNATAGSGKFVFEEFSLASGGEILFRFGAQSGNTIAGILSGSGTFASSATGNRYLRIQRNGNEARYKTWSVGSAEPTSWTSTGASTSTSPWPVGISYSYTGGGSAVIDYMAVNEQLPVALPDVAIIETPATASGVMVDPTVSTFTSANVSVAPATASALMVDPVFSNATVLNVTAAVATASALMVDPTVSVTRNPTVAVDPFLASGLMTGGGFALPVMVTASPATASGTAPDASVSAERNALVSVQPAISTGVLAGILLMINGVEIDPALASDRYRQRLLATTDTEDFWYRLDESSGTTLADARGNALKIANLFGSYSFNVYGPESRKAIHMENGYFAPQVNGTPDSKGGIDSESTSNMTFEIVLRTTDANGVLAYGLDNRFQSSEFRNAVYLKDGKVSVEWNRLDGGPTPFSLTGFKNVADGQWHHIVVTAGARSTKELDNGVRIYIDGKLDVRRRTELIPDLWATPDSYMGMPEAWRMVTPLYPWQDNLTGDVMEVVFRKDADLVQDEAIELFYDAFGIVPVRVQPATATGYMPEASGRGNQKRALVLYTRWYGAGNITGNLAGFEQNAPSSYSTTIPDEFDHEIQIGRIYEPGENQWTDLAGFRVMPVSIMREDSVPGAPYRDAVTDLPRLLDLQEDLNLDDYDVILFRNWPDEGADQEVFRARGYSNDAIEDFLGSVKQAVVDGKSLEITSPNLASRLGLIRSAQPIPMILDRKVGVGERDLRASIVNPWDVDKQGNTYLDIHANNWHRVVANVENLTDEPTYERIVEAYLNWNDGADGQVNNQWGYKLEQGALQIGDELIDPVQFWNRVETYAQTNVVTERPWDRYLWAITPDGLSVGTPLYRFANKMWQGNTEVDNPYREFIGGAIVQPGDVWDGQQIAGKVFINLAESPFTALKATEVMTRQIVPPNEEIENPDDREDAAKREWDYSFTRVAFSAVDAGVRNGGETKFELVTKSDGSQYYVIASTGIRAGLVGIEINEKYETEPVLTPSWALRGLAWLAATEEVTSGSVTVRPTAAIATGAMGNTVALAEKSATVNAQAAIALGQMVSPDEVVEPDVTVFAFPAYASGVMTGYGKTIAVAPFEGSGVLVDNFDLISASGEQVVLYLHRVQEVELYLMEGTK